MGAFNIFETDNQEEAAIVKAAFDGRGFALVTTSSLTGGVDNRPYVLTVSGRDIQDGDADYYRAFTSGLAVMRTLALKAAETRTSYELFRCANVDCPGGTDSLKVQGGSKVGIRPDVQIRRGAKRFRVTVCSACFNQFNAVPEGYGRRAKNG